MVRSLDRCRGRLPLRSRIGLGLLMALAAAPGGFIVLRTLTLPRDSPGLPDLCPLHRITGLWCPLCGGTRATRELIHGDVWTALGYNPFALVVEVLAVALVVRWLLAFARGRRRQFVTGERPSFLVRCALLLPWCETFQECGSTSGPCSAPRGDGGSVCIMQLWLSILKSLHV